MAPDPAPVDAKANEPKEASPAPTECSAPDTSGHDGQLYKTHTHSISPLY